MKVSKSNKQSSIVRILLCVIFLLVLSNLYFFKKSTYYPKVRVALGIQTNLPISDESQSAWTKSLKSLNDSVDVAFFGHSIVHFGDWETYFPEKKVVNLGRSCHNVFDMQTRISQLVYVHPKKVFVMAGTNTIGHYTENEAKEGYSKLLLSIRDSLANAEIYVHDVLPVIDDMRTTAWGNLTNENINRFNQFIKKFCLDNNFKYIPISNEYKNKDGQLDNKYTKDGCHLSPNAYGKWIDKIKAYL